MPVEYARRYPRRRAAAGPAGPSGAAAATGEEVSHRSSLALYVALAIVLAGWWLATWTLLAPAFLALLLLSTGMTFLGTRLNPLSVGFYLTVKPSWTAIAGLFLGGVLLLAITYTFWRHGWAPVLPHRLVPW